MTLTMRYAARSDRGLIRHGNQDSVYAGPRLLAVADGMGGMAAGDVASNIVIGALAHLDEDVPGNAPVDALRLAVDAANQQIRDAVDENPAMEGMGTTLTGMLFGGSKFGMVHIGDSRAYLLRDGEFVQITRDDTYVQLLVDEGRITPEEANTHPQKSLLMRALDGRDADPEYSVRQAVPGDRYLICSDGLSGVVSDETIGATMREYSDPNQCAERLIQLALRGGGPDNITVIVADVTDADILEEAPVVGGAAANDRGMISSADASTPAARASALTQPREAAPAEPAARGFRRRPEPASDPDHPDPGRCWPACWAAGCGSAGGTPSRSTTWGSPTTARSRCSRAFRARSPASSLSTVDYLSNTKIADLTPVAQSKVREGIPAADQTGARSQLESLLDPGSKNVLPYCQTPTPSPTPSPRHAIATPSALASPPRKACRSPPSTPSPTVAQTPETTTPTGPPDCRQAVR